MAASGAIQASRIAQHTQQQPPQQLAQFPQGKTASEGDRVNSQELEKLLDDLESNSDIDPEEIVGDVVRATGEEIKDLAKRLSCPVSTEA
jgi:hypothetical protein